LGLGSRNQLAFARKARILFGTDYPFAPANVAASFTAKLDAYETLTADEHSAINHDNAGILFPRLAPKDAAPERRSART
jgi:6-methylsalicylate decarboxylase